MGTDNVLPFERRVPPNPPQDFDVRHALRQCEALLKSLGQYQVADDMFEAGMALLLVNLNDLVQRARSVGQPLVFTEHVDTSEDVANISELVTRCRNAACHVWGRSSDISSASLHFTRISGYYPRATVLDGKVLGCDFHDDIAVYYGRYRIYLNRHIGRAVRELARLAEA